MIIGFGETDEEVLDCVRELASMGVVANIRAIRVNEVNRAQLEKNLGSKIGIRDPKRVAQLVKAQKAIFKKYGLRPELFQTMCHRCACCDLTVGRDL